MGINMDETAWQREASLCAEIERLREEKLRWMALADKRAIEVGTLKVETERLRAETQRLRAGL
jgi:hypothetical protein